jgi:hypothetical protein
MVNRIPPKEACRVLFMTALQQLETIYTQIRAVRKSDERYEYNIQQYALTSAALSSAIQSFKTADQRLLTLHVDYTDMLAQAATCQAKFQRLQQAWQDIHVSLTYAGPYGRDDRETDVTWIKKTSGNLRARLEKECGNDWLTVTYGNPAAVYYSDTKSANAEIPGEFIHTIEDNMQALQDLLESVPWAAI